MSNNEYPRLVTLAGGELLLMRPVRERERTYIYADGSALTIEEVVGVGVTNSGSHRIETAYGTRLIPRSDWLCVEVDTDEWSF